MSPFCLQPVQNRDEIYDLQDVLSWVAKMGHVQTPFSILSCSKAAMISDCHTRMPRNRVRMHILLCSWNVSLKDFRKSEYSFLLGEAKELSGRANFSIIWNKAKWYLENHRITAFNIFKICFLICLNGFVQWLETKKNILLKLF